MPLDIDKTGVAFRSSEKPLVTTFHAPRTMRFFPISQSELDQVSTFNIASTVCFSISAFFLGLIPSCIWDKVQAGSEWTGGEKSFVAAAAMFSVVFCVAGGFFLWAKKSRLTGIFRECDS